jgi:hypothetical protein
MISVFKFIVVILALKLLIEKNIFSKIYQSVKKIMLCAKNSHKQLEQESSTNDSIQEGTELVSQRSIDSNASQFLQEAYQG